MCCTCSENLSTSLCTFFETKFGWSDRLLYISNNIFWALPKTSWLHFVVWSNKFVTFCKQNHDFYLDFCRFPFNKMQWNFSKTKRFALIKFIWAFLKVCFDFVCLIWQMLPPYYAFVGSILLLTTIFIENRMGTRVCCNTATKTFTRTKFSVD